MKKILFFIMAFCFVQLANAQTFDAEKSAAFQLVTANQSSLGLSADDLNNLVVSSSYVDKNSGIRYVYLQQAYKNIPVYNQIQVITFKDNKVLSNAGGRIKNIEQKVAVSSGIPSLTAESAVMAAISDRKLSTTQFATAINSKQNGREVEFGNLGVSRENITAQLLWVPSIKNPNEVSLAWQIYIIPQTFSDYWLVRIDAASGRTLGADNLTVYCNWDDPMHNLLHSLENTGVNTKTVDLKQASQLPVQTPGSPTLADNAIYRVVPLPYEAPSFMPGPPSTVSNPWTAGSANATTLKWHSTDATGTDYNYTRGNNVWAYQDRNNQNVGDPTRSATSTTPLPNLNFDFVPDLTQPPINTTPPNQQFNITNLFYANNILHDVLYNYGFDEPAGNFQDNNLGRGGLGNDHVNAEAQDGSGTNNANFATPADGGSGRMQMYLWTLSSPQRDGDVDNGVIFHEFGHGVSNRLTGGPTNASCLQNAEQMGEGWSDYNALMLTQDWANSNLNTGFTSPRGIGTYVLNQPTTGLGIRSQKYCTDFTVNNKVYAASIPATPHDRGEIWCATLWDMTWNIIQQEGVINPNIYNLAGGGGNTIALKLVMEGMKLQPCSPGFIDGRDGIIQADINLYGGAHLCAIKEAFRRRGMGEGASQGSSFSVTDQIPSFTGASTTFTQQPQSTTACAGSVVAFTVAATGSPTFTYQWQVSTNGGGTWTNITGATAATYSFTCAAGDNGKQYRCVVSSTCGATNSNAGTLTITTLSNGGTVNPATATACSPVNSTTLTLTGYVGNIIQWEYSTDGGTTWTVVANTTATLTATNIAQNRIYRALVQSTGCSASYSAISTITYIASGVGNLVITSDVPTTLCQGDPALLTALSAVPGTATVSSGPISVGIPDNSATGVSTPLTVSGIPANAVGSSASVLFNITHTWDGDLALFLKAPNNQVLNLVNQRGGSADNFVNTVISSTATTPIASGAAPFTGTFLPDGNTGAPAPAGFTPTATTFAPLYSTAGQLNGTWLFGARDVAGGDVGTITSWSLTLNYNALSNNPGLTYTWTPATGLNAANTNPVAASPATTTTYTVTATNGTGCTANASITLTINQRPAVTTHPNDTSVCSGSAAIFNVGATGTGITYQWQESTNGGTTWTSLSNAAPYSGVNTPSLTVNPTTSAMNSYRYRCVISGTCPPAANSKGAVLTVKALPNVTVNPVSGCGGIAGINGLALTASGGDTYVWSPVTGLYTNTGATTAYTGTNLATVYAAPTVFTAYTVTATSNTSGCSNTATALINYTPPAPNVAPNPVAMCLGDAAVKLKSSSSTATTVSFSSGTINLAIPDNNPAGVTSTINVSGVPTTSAISNVTAAINMTHTWDGDMVFVLKAPNGKIINLDYYLSSTGGAGATTGFTNTRISSTGTAALSSGTNPYTNIFKADAVLGGAFGQAGPTGNIPNTQLWSDLTTPVSSVNGTWTLGMYDGGPADLGTLTSWSLQFTYVLGVPAAPAVWSPAAGLFKDALASQPYVAGTAVDSVWARPTPAGTYTYQATVNSLPPASTPISTNFAAGNGNYVITFNFKNGNNYPVTITDIASLAFAAGQSNVAAYYNATNIAGSPGAITAGNGWIQFGSATITATGGTTVDPFMSGLSLVVPANTTYRLLVSCQTSTGGFNMGYSTLGGGVFTFSGNGCSIITGDNIGYGGPQIPGTPANTPRGFIGSVGFIPGSVATCTSPARIVTVTVNQPISVTTHPVNAAVCTDKVTSFTVAAAGTTPSYQWQVSTDVGNTFTNIANGGVYSGVTTATLTVTAPPVSMNGYLYRCVVSGAAPCASVASNMAKLTVNPLPTIVISAAPFQRLMPGLKTTLSSTVSPIAQTYTWLKNGTAVGGATGATLTIDVDGVGEYTLRVTDVNGCTNTSNLVSIKDSVSGKVFIYPTPNAGQFQVRYYSIVNNSGLPRGINIYDARGKRVLTNTYSIGAPYARMDVDLRNHGSGVYWVEVVDANGNRLAVGRTEVLR